MENIIFNNKEELNDFIKKHSIKNLGMGREGVCFLLDNYLVIKKLYEEYNTNFALQFKDLNIDSFIFAKSGVIINNYVNAIFMEYVKGFTLLEKIPENINMLVLENNFKN